MVNDPDPEFSAIYKRDEAIVARQIAGEMILVPIRQHVGDLESIFLLNETAIAAWELFDGAHSLAEIRDTITSQFDVDEQQAGADLLELVFHLLQIRALVKV